MVRTALLIAACIGLARQLIKRGRLIPPRRRPASGSDRSSLYQRTSLRDLTLEIEGPWRAVHERFGSRRPRSPSFREGIALQFALQAPLLRRRRRLQRPSDDAGDRPKPSADALAELIRFLAPHTATEWRC
jgi:hypothetical protein